MAAFAANLCYVVGIMVVIAGYGVLVWIGERFWNYFRPLPTYRAATNMSPRVDTRHAR